MTEPTTSRRPQAPASGRIFKVWHLFVAAIAAVTVLAAGRVIEEPSFVERVVIENPTRYDVMVDVTDARRSGWLAVGTAEREDISTLEEILDQGDTWIFRFTSQGRVAGELRLTRAELEASDWNIFIPVKVGDDLRDQGAPTAP